MDPVDWMPEVMRAGLLVVRLVAVVDRLRPPPLGRRRWFGRRSFEPAAELAGEAERHARRLDARRVLELAVHDADELAGGLRAHLEILEDEIERRQGAEARRREALS